MGEVSLLFTLLQGVAQPRTLSRNFFYLCILIVEPQSQTIAENSIEVRNRRKIAQNFLLFSKRNRVIIPVGNLKVGSSMAEKPDVLQGTLALMVLKTLDLLGPQHGWGIARRIEQISGDLLAVNQGTLYPLLLKLEHEGTIASKWGISENNRKARFYSLTAAGRKQLKTETRDWEQTAAIIARFFNVKGEDLA